MTEALAPVLTKPRLRGWLHVYAFVISAVAGIVLVSVAAATEGARAAMATGIYATTVALLFGTSAVYHRVRWSTETRRRLMSRLDHSMIFLFIAGSYTPFALLLMPRRTGATILLVVWLGAVAGVLLKTSWITAPRWLSVPLYIALGWVAVFVFPDLLQHGGVAAIVLLAAGGLFYTAGGIVYGLKRPDPWPATFGFHEVFHLCTVIAAACHMVAVWLAVYSG